MMVPTDAVTLSIVLVAYHSQTDLERCLPTIDAQDVVFPSEIIVVNNSPADGLGEWLARTYPAVRYVANASNTGYAGGNNLGLGHARGHWSLLINPDTELRPGSLAWLLKTAREHPDALLTPKLLNPDGTINACGNQMHYTGIATCRGLNEPGDRYATLHTVPLLSGAAIVGRTELLRALGGFDETYFMYYEDTDLSLRARRRGIELLCEGRAEIVHHYALNMNAAKFYYLERNRLLTFLKLFSRPTLRALLPALLLTEVLTWGYALRGPAYLRSRFRTYRSVWSHRAAIRQARNALQQTPATVPDADLLAGSTLSLPLASLLPRPLSTFADGLITSLFRLLIPKRLRAVSGWRAAVDALRTR